jgi:hypothetical protein
MNYERIYREFIADRREREAGLTGYTESHHILPRSLGGGNGKANLIRLTAEDHFFAHLLLARIHGGTMWAPIALMIGQKKHWRPIRSRREYGWVKRELARAGSGEGAYQFDHRTYELAHEDGRQWTGRQSDMPDLGISKSLANMLIKGRVGSARGWYLLDRPPVHIGQGARPGALHTMADHRVHRFRHVNGDTFEGTQLEFRAAKGVPQQNCSALVRGARSISRGWHIDGVTPTRVGRAGTYF